MFQKLANGQQPATAQQEFQGSPPRMLSTPGASGSSPTLQGPGPIGEYSLSVSGLICPSCSMQHALLFGDCQITSGVYKEVLVLLALVEGGWGVLHGLFALL